MAPRLPKQPVVLVDVNPAAPGRLEPEAGSAAHNEARTAALEQRFKCLPQHLYGAFETDLTGTRVGVRPQGLDDLVMGDGPTAVEEKEFQQEPYFLGLPRSVRDGLAVT